MSGGSSTVLRIDEVPLAGGGRLGLAACLGARGPLGADLDAIRAWGASDVVTLIEPHEAAADLGDATEARGMEWYHLPIADGMVPGTAFEAGWTYAGLRLRRRLGGGERVLVHCLGGLGRTGTVAARLLIELGWEPAAALAAVRQARPGAVETAVQERYVLGRTSARFAEPFVDRLLGCLLGGAVGDAFGYAVEFLRLQAIRQRFGAQGIVEPVLQRGRLVVSDDTQMTLFTLEGVLRAVQPDGTFEPDALIEEVREAYLDWLATQGHGSPDRGLAGDLASVPALRAQRAPGGTCLSALDAGGQGSIERPINDSKGCGAVMRTAPLGLLPVPPEVAYTLAARAGALTHGHVEGWSSGALLAAMVRELVAGRDLAGAASRAMALGDPTGTVRAPWRSRDLMRRACALAREDAPAEAAFAALGEGWVGEEALAIGLWAALGAEDLLDALRRGANHDGDSDSTASIAGQLYGAWHGIEAVPHRLVRRLDVVDPLLELAHRAAAIPTPAAPC